MKRVLTAYCVLILLTVSPVPAEEWVWQNPLPQGAEIISLAAVGDSLYGFSARGLAVAVGPNSAEARPHVAGWDEFNFWELVFTDAQHGWGRVPHAGAWPNYYTPINYTSNGGATWTEQYRRTAADLNDYFALDAQHAWAVGTSRDTTARCALILRTTDGGQSWQESIRPGLPHTFYKVTFINPLEGFATTEGGYFAHSTDGGATWEFYTIPYQFHGSWTADLHFHDSNLGWVINSARIYRTTDGGQTWAQTGSASNDLFSLAAADSQNVWAVGALGGVFQSTNGGITWTARDLGTRVTMKRVLFTSPQHGWIAGDYGTLLETTDGGQNWVWRGGNPDTEDIVFSNAQFADLQQGWLVGRDNAPGDWAGVVFHTTNGGTDWQRLPGSGDRWASGVAVISAQEIWTVGEHVWRTTNGGATWNQVAVPAAYTYSQIEYLGNGIFWIYCYVGDELDFVYRSTDGGATWQTGTVPHPYKNYAFTAVDAEHAWAADCVGDTESLIRKTTDGGQTWTDQYDEPTWLNAIFFLDTLNGWAGGWGSNGLLLLHTTDGGTNWVEQAVELDEYAEVLGIRFFTPELGWLQTSYGVAWRTTNGGATWERFAVNASSPYSYWGRLCFADANHLWFVGWGGGIQHLVTSVADAPEPPAAVPLALSLSAFPNPFNPSTTIAFDLPAAGRVTLAIYDLTGREIRTLTDRVYAAGSHTVHFDGSNLASGIYFARLKSPEQTRTHKLVLLK